MNRIPKIEVDDDHEDPEDLSVDVEDEEDSGETSLSPKRDGLQSSPLSGREGEEGMMEDEDEDEIADEDDVDDDDDAVKRDHPKVERMAHFIWQCPKVAYSTSDRIQRGYTN